MDDLPSTRASLLIRLRDPQDERAWAEFVELYRPLVRRLARRRGLQEADADDLAQDVFRAVASAIGRFECDPARGSFRAWLSTIARNLILNLLSSRGHRLRGSGDSEVARWLDEQPDPQPEDTSAEFDREYRRQLFDWAASHVREEVSDLEWRAFQLGGVEGRPAAEVAARLGTTIGTVYSYKSRVMARLKRRIESFSDGL